MRLNYGDFHAIQASLDLLIERVERLTVSVRLIIISFHVAFECVAARALKALLPDWRGSTFSLKIAFIVLSFLHPLFSFKKQCRV